MNRLRRAMPLLALVCAGCLQPALPREDPARWAAEIERFAEEDRSAPLEKGCVVFLGSSSIRLWSTLRTDMAPVPVLNRGFGGSTLSDAIHYADVLVSVHQPSVVVVFSGTNDIAGEHPKSAEQVRELVRELVGRLRAADPELTIGYIAITPTPAREEHLAVVRESNRLIARDCERDPHFLFLDPTAEFLDANGRPDPQWFGEDRLHLNRRGYEVWTRHIRPVVQQLYEREGSRAHRGRPG